MCPIYFNQTNGSSIDRQLDKSFRPTQAPVKVFSGRLRWNPSPVVQMVRDALKRVDLGPGGVKGNNVREREGRVADVNGSLLKVLDNTRPVSEHQPQQADRRTEMGSNNALRGI
jgi:hypothetical protein